MKAQLHKMKVLTEGFLELTINDGNTFLNVTGNTVGGSFTGGGYNCTINPGSSNPLGGQSGWCASQAVYKTSTLILPGRLSGKTIKLRWRAGWDSRGANPNPNWRIDTMTLKQPSCAAFASTTPVINSATPNPSIVGQSVVVNYSFPSPFASLAPPTGNVIVSDGVDSCTGTVAAGQCTIVLNTTGNRTLKANYLGDSTNAAAVSAGVPHQVNVLTAAGAEVSGRVLTNKGRGVANAVVTMTDGNGNSRSNRANSFGYFRLPDVPVGATYIISIASKSYHFAPQVIAVNQDLTDLKFTAQ